MGIAEHSEGSSRFGPARRILVVGVVLALLVSHELALLLLRVVHRSVQPSFLPHGLVVFATWFPFVLVAGVVLWRGPHSGRGLIGSGTGGLGFLLLAIANAVSPSTCPVDAATESPQVRWWGPPDYLLGIEVPIPQVAVIAGDCYMAVNVGILGLGFALVACWFWFGGLPERILDSLGEIRR